MQLEGMDSPHQLPASQQAALSTAAAKPQQLQHARLPQPAAPKAVAASEALKQAAQSAVLAPCSADNTLGLAEHNEVCRNGIERAKAFEIHNDFYCPDWLDRGSPPVGRSARSDTIQFQSFLMDYGKRESSKSSRVNPSFLRIHFNPARLVIELIHSRSSKLHRSLARTFKTSLSGRENFCLKNLTSLKGKSKGSDRPQEGN